jgi:hypothetical protein
MVGSLALAHASQLLDPGVARLGEALERQPVEVVELLVDVYRQSRKVSLQVSDDT